LSTHRTSFRDIHPNLQTGCVNPMRARKN